MLAFMAKMFRLDPVAAFEEMFMKSPAAKQYAEAFSGQTPPAAPGTSLNTTVSTPAATAHTMFQRLKAVQPQKASVPTQAHGAQDEHTDDEMSHTSEAADDISGDNGALTKAPVVQKTKIRSAAPKGQGQGPVTYLTPELIATRHVPNAYDLSPNANLLRNGKEIGKFGVSVKEEPMDTSDELPAIDVPSAVTRQEDSSVTRQPDRAATRQPDKAVTRQPDKAVARQTNRAVTRQPDSAITRQPDRTIARQPDRTVVRQPDRAVARQPDRTVTRQPDSTVARQPDSAVARQPDSAITREIEDAVTMETNSAVTGYVDDVADRNIESENEDDTLASQTDQEDLNSRRQSRNEPEESSAVRTTKLHSASTKQTSVKKKLAVISIDDWIIVPWGSSDLGICVEGHRRIDKPGEYWKSSRIVKRVNNRLVETQSGQRYRLIGDISRKDALEHEFEEYMVDAFTKGFPANWEEYVEEMVQNRNRDIKREMGTEAEMDKNDKSHNSRHKKVEVRRSKRQTHPTPSFDDTPINDKKTTSKTTKAEPKKPEKKPKTTGKKTKTSEKIPKSTTTSSKAKKEEKEPVSLGDLPKTRSGRTVKPPVQHWAGQRYVYSSHTDNVDIVRPDLSLTPASDVSMNATPIVTFKVDARVRMIEKRARQELLNNSLSKRRKKSASKNDNSVSHDKDSSQDVTMDTDVTIEAEDTDSEIRVNLGGSPTSYKSGNPRATETLAEKRYAETLANTLKATSSTDGTPLTRVSAGSSNALRLRKSLQLEMDPEEDMFSSDDGEAISKVKRRNRNVIESSEESDNNALRIPSKKAGGNSLLKKVLVNQNVAALKGQHVDVIEAMETPATNRLRSVKDLNKLDKPEYELKENAQQQQKPKSSRHRLSRSPAVLLKRINANAQEHVESRSQSTDSDCLTDDHSPVAKRVTRQTRQKTVARKQQEATKPNKQTRVRPAQKLPEVTEDPVVEFGECDLGRESLQGQQDKGQGQNKRSTTAKAKGSAARRGRKRTTESEVTESESDVRKKSAKSAVMATAKTKTNGNHGNRNKKSALKERQEIVEPTIADMLRDVGNKRRNQRTEWSDQSDDENNDPPWTDAEIIKLKKAVSMVERDTPYYWTIISDHVGSRNALQCQQFHQGEAPSTVKKKPKSRAHKQKVTQLSEVTAGKGTMKRKQQLRELVEHHDMAGDEDDDFFNSTPMRGTKPTGIGCLMEDSFNQGLSSMQTPAMLKMLTPNSRMSHLMLSEKKTPASHMHIITPKVTRSADRNDVYIHRIKNRKHIGSSHPQTSKAVVKDSGAGHVKMTSDMFETHQVAQNDVDSDEQEDYYFTDED